MYTARSVQHKQKQIGSEIDTESVSDSYGFATNPDESSPDGASDRLSEAAKALHTRLQQAHRNGPLDKLGKANQRPEPGEEDRQQARHTMAKRARAKYCTMQVVKDLIALDSPMREKYERALGCCSTIRQEDGALTSHYCKDRWCIVCNRIRMGRRIDAYKPVFEAWAESDGVYMVTLTVPNVGATRLSSTLDEMQHQLKLCRRSIRRTRELEYESVRSTEVTFNAERRDFHPHYHIAVRGEEQAKALVEEWLKRWPRASRVAQNVRSWDGSEKGLRELTKYCTKLIGGTRGDVAPATWALDEIFQALQGRHLFRPVGFELSEYVPDLDPEAVEDFEDLEVNVVAFSRPDEKVLWTWDSGVNDWVDLETGECLTCVDAGDPSDFSGSLAENPP